MPEESNQPIEPAQPIEHEPQHTIDTGGGMYIENGTINNSGVNVLGGKVKNIYYNNNQGAALIVQYIGTSAGSEVESASLKANLPQLSDLFEQYLNALLDNEGSEPDELDAERWGGKAYIPLSALKQNPAPELESTSKQELEQLLMNRPDSLTG